MNNEKRFECDVVVMPGAELDTDICITGNVYMTEGSNANGYDIDVGVWDVSAMGTVEVQVDVHAQNIMALEKIFKDVKSDAKKLQSKQVEFYLSVG